ncbi:hypothetical protein ACFQ6Q_00505 [Streptomyces sp. NPDC056437]|uniref:hypothetical protein n=1 Tax=Streptomyces sp. NPDC056437 TaxID=3345816 RepID=UPI003695DB97
MASDTVPATAPGEPARGLLASMVAPIDPARPTFDLTPTGPNEATSGPGTPPDGTSSAAYHGEGDGTETNARNTGSTTTQKGVIRAWLLAGAARWAKGGGTQNKRLDTKKAMAQANQVKEARTVTVNRGGGMLGKGSTGPGSGGKSSGPGGKSSTGKSGSGGTGNGPKNSTGPKNGPSNKPGGGTRPGPSGSGGRGPGGGSAGGKGAGAGPKTVKDDGGRRTPKQSPAPGPKRDTSGGKGGPSGVGGSTNKNTPRTSDGPGSKTPKGPDSSTKTPKQQTSKPHDGTSGKTAGPKGSTGPAGTPGPKTPDKPKPPASGTTTDLSKTSTPAKDQDPKGAHGKDSDGKGGKLLSLVKKPSAKDQPKTTPKTAPMTVQTAGKPLNTGESRATGYRDGTRAARITAHVQAYSHGVKDGWTDTTEAAARDKARLDQAHQNRKQQHTEEQPVNGTGTSADHHGPQPIGVKEVTATHVLLGDGATRSRVSRGEVRSLKNFERLLGAKADSMAKVAEATKAIKAQADERAKQATDLLETAKSVKGGEKLAAVLARLQEDAAVQSGKAEDIQKRAVRAGEGCAAVLSNVTTRYEGIYQAVVDSPETAPAELHFYKG